MFHKSCMIWNPIPTAPNIPVPCSCLVYRFLNRISDRVVISPTESSVRLRQWGRNSTEMVQHGVRPKQGLHKVKWTYQRQQNHIEELIWRNDLRKREQFIKIKQEIIQKADNFIHLRLQLAGDFYVIQSSLNRATWSSFKKRSECETV